jgi:adenosylhomocysteine nucleosidase
LSGIGLVVALPREIPRGFVRIRQHATVEPAAFVGYRHKTAASQLIAAQVGIGRRRAAEGARQLIHRFSPCALVSFGFAGGLIPQLTRGTLVIGTALASGDSAQIVAGAHRPLIDQFYAAAEAEGLPVQRGPVVTAKHIVADAASKAALRRKSGACAVDMETAGIVQAAREVGLPWVTVRAIIDSATDPMPMECLTMLGDDGHVAVGLLMRMVWRSPSLVRHFVTLARGTALAQRHLSRLLARWVSNRPAQGPLVQG